MTARINPGRFRSIAHSCLVGILLLSIIFINLGSQPVQADFKLPERIAKSLVSPQQEVLVDDFVPAPIQGEAIYYYNRIGGDRGALNYSTLNLNAGEMTITIAPGQQWGGLWTSLNHPSRESVGLDFSAVFPAQIQPKYQSQITAMRLEISGGTAGRILRLELKDGASIRWSRQEVLTGTRQVMSSSLPDLGNITDLVIVLDQASGGDQITLDTISLTAVTQITDPLEAAFVWSYGMLLNNWNPDTGLARDKATDASGEYDAIQCTGSLAAATAVAAQLGVVSWSDAVVIVNKINATLLNELPRYKGLWPHWVELNNSEEFVIVKDTEWSSVDTAIAALGLLDAQVALGLNPSGVIQFLKEIEWDALLMPDGISHGYADDGTRLVYAWDTFGGESVLIDLVYAAVTREVPPLRYPLPTTANGSGFIDEMAWLLVIPPTGPDVWAADWPAYRADAVQNQLNYYPDFYPGECMSQLELFGLSAAEVPAPSDVPVIEIYQPYGIGGRFIAPNDGHPPFEGPVVTPHYAGMVATLLQDETRQMWSWLIDGPFSPLNNVESLLFPIGGSCDYEEMTWNHLKGSWNLALQALGLGRRLAEERGMFYALWRPSISNPFLRAGYQVLYSVGDQTTYLPLVMK